MGRAPAKRAAKVAPKKTGRAKSPVKQAAERVAADAAQIRVDVDQLLKSLDHLGVLTLRRVVERATVLIDEKTEGEKRSFIEEVTARAKGFGMSLADIVGRAVPESVRPAALGRKPVVIAKRASPTIKYKGPNGEPWSGRGRTPRWLVTAEAEGKKREDFAV
jgi:DNA-binding protein H-NS